MQRGEETGGAVGKRGQSPAAAHRAASSDAFALARGEGEPELQVVLQSESASADDTWCHSDAVALRPVHKLFLQWIRAQRAADRLLKEGSPEEEWEAAFDRIADIEHKIAADPSDPVALAVTLYLVCHRENCPPFGADPAGLNPDLRTDRLVVDAIRAAARWVPEIATLAAPIIDGEQDGPDHRIGKAGPA